jgi:CcmD family protein
MNWKTTAARLVFGLLCLCSAASPSAQQPTPRPSDPAAAQPPSAAQEGFVPVDQLPKPQDTMPAAPLVATAYAFVWVMLFAYMVSIWRRLNAVERELHSVSRRIGSGGRTP